MVYGHGKKGIVCQKVEAFILAGYVTYRWQVNILATLSHLAYTEFLTIKMQAAPL